VGSLAGIEGHGKAGSGHHGSQIARAGAGRRTGIQGLYNPCVLCTSINDEIVHGIRLQSAFCARKFEKIDVGAEVEGYYGADAIRAGISLPALQQLMRVTEESLYAAIERVRLGSRVGDISSTVEQYVTPYGYSVVRDFVGHGIGSHLHEDPKVPNYGTAGMGPKLKEGMVLAIQPMVNTEARLRVLRDRWTAVTEDGVFI
jgi:methionyl aminopeptidase